MELQITFLFVKSTKTTFTSSKVKDLEDGLHDPTATDLKTFFRFPKLVPGMFHSPHQDLEFFFVLLCKCQTSRVGFCPWKLKHPFVNGCFSWDDSKSLHKILVV